MESILTSIKKLLGLTEEQTEFDQDVIIHINSVFSILNQLGVGPSEGFIIKNKEATWSEFVSDIKNLETIKSYMYLQVKLLFDPPLSSTVMESNNKIIEELKWRINVIVDPKENGEEENNG